MGQSTGLGGVLERMPIAGFSSLPEVVQIFLLVAIVLHAAAFLAWGFLFIREQRGPKEKAKAH